MNSHYILRPLFHVFHKVWSYIHQFQI